MESISSFSNGYQAQPIATVLEQLLPYQPDYLDSEQNAQIIAECQQWLTQHQEWGKLPAEIDQEIAHSLLYLQVDQQTLIYQEGQTPIGLYFLKSGTIEIFRQSANGRSLIRYRNAGDLFGQLLIANTVSGTYQSNAIALTSSEIYFLPIDTYEKLICLYPLIQQVMNGLISSDLQEYESRIAWEEERMRSLQLYIQHIPSQSHILGNSKAAKKIELQINQAAANLQPVILQAEAGTGKTFVAGLIHTLSGNASQPFVEIDCAKLPHSEDERLNTDILFGRNGERAGILELLERGTLLLNNIHVLSSGDRTRIGHYLQTGLVLPNHGIISPNNLDSELPKPIPSSVRLILAAPKKLDLPNINAITIKLLTLPQRKSDIPAFANYFLTRFCEEQNRPALQLDQSDLRRLLSYDYPANISELAEILHRAVIMTPQGHTIIPEQALWSVQSKKNAFRLDLLTHVPWLRKLFLSRWYPEGIWIVMMAIFVPVTILGFIGAQDREHSLTLNLFWAWWWPGYLFLFVFVGRLWCAVCPFMIMGEWLRRLSLWLFPRQQLTWNTKWLNHWGAWIVFIGFVAIYLWEKLWDLPHHAYLSSWLLIVITAGAVIFSQIYERRLWCRYLCPIGGMNGMFAKLSMVELRSTQQVCGSQCHSFGCYKGSAATSVTFIDALPNEGQATEGCPLYSHPNQLQDNRDCMLCMTCLKACPNRSVQLNLRFPASDLLDNHQGFNAEIALLLLLLGGVFMHHTQDILEWLGLGTISINSDRLLVSIPIVLVILSIPALLTYPTHAIARFFDPKQPDYRIVVYAYLPLTLAANLAHYIPAAITEAGKSLPIFAAAIGWNDVNLPSLIWSMDVAQFLQGVTLLSVLAFSPYPLLRITKRSWLSNLPHLLLMGGLTTLFFKLMI